MGFILLEMREFLPQVVDFVIPKPSGVSDLYMKLFRRASIHVKHAVSVWLEEKTRTNMQRVNVHLATTGELHSTKVLPCGSRVVDLLKELNEEKNHISIVLSGERVLDTQERLPCGEEISVQLLRQSLFGRWRRRTGAKPTMTKAIHEYKEEILLLRPDGQGRFSMTRTLVAHATGEKYGDDIKTVGCSPVNLKEDPDGLGRFLQSSEEGAPWQVQVLGGRAEPSVCIKGAGWRMDHLFKHEVVAGPQSFVVPLQALWKTWEFST